MEYYEGVAFKFLSVSCHTWRASIRGGHSHIPLGTALISQNEVKGQETLETSVNGQEALEMSVNRVKRHLR